MSALLKPCPFCGSKPVSRDFRASSDDEIDGYASVECPNCRNGFVGMHYDTLPEAVAAWNRRSQPSDDELTRATLADALAKFVGNWLMTNTSLDVEKIVDCETAVRAIAIQGDESREPDGYLFELRYPGDRWSGTMFSEQMPPDGDYRNLRPLFARLDGAGTPEGSEMERLRERAIIGEYNWTPAELAQALADRTEECAQVCDEYRSYFEAPLLDGRLNRASAAALATAALGIRALSPPSQEAANGPAKSERIERGTR